MNQAALPSRPFLCVRHGLTEWNLQGRFQGRTDIALNDEGVSQAKSAARRLQSVALDCVVSSPLIRAVTTAEIIAKSSGIPLTIEPALAECDFGSFEGRSIGEVMAEHGVTTKQALAGILPPDAEDWTSVTRRSLRCVSGYLNRDSASSILFVSHDAVMQSIAEMLCGRWFDNHHGTPYKFAQTDNVWTVLEVA